MNVTVNDKPVPAGIAKIFSALTRTEKVGATALSVAPLLSLTIDLDNMTADCPHLEAIRNMADMDSVIHVEDEGDTPRPRHLTFRDMIERLEAVIKIAAPLTYATQISDSVKGTVTFEGKASRGDKTQDTSEIDFTVKLG